MFETRSPAPPLSHDDTEATWVSTEIAEHHGYHSYSGFMCLLQISDKNENWVVDLLAARDEVESSNDPHGAERNIVWLQQDFNIYIVNLFDTFHLSKLLGQSPCFFPCFAFLVPPSYFYFQTSRDTG
jgi:exosome complex exonuclease RRP6